MAPNLDLFLYRPAMAEPPLCSWMDCRRSTLMEIADMHEALDLRAAQQQRAAKAMREVSRHGCR